VSAPNACLSQNRLLAALPPEEYARLLPHLTVIGLQTRAMLHPANEPFDSVYFPLTAVASVTTLMADGAMVEVGTIGHEGMTGLPAFFGAEASPLPTFIQVPGEVAQLPLAAFQEAVAPGTALHTLLLRYAQAYYVMAAQSAGCNRLHPVVERCARWLLLTHDRVGLDTFALSHEFLGYMLGVRRASVTIAMGTLQGAGLITNHRGILTIRDRPGLEAASCECYAAIHKAFAALPGPV
jgi:CRP-like cAMP-binding protein